jgi:hypothetical protein
MVRGRSAHRRRELGRCCGCSPSALFAKKRWKGTEYEGGARSFYLTAGRSGQLAPWVAAPPRVCYNRRRAALLFLATARRRRPVREFAPDDRTSSPREVPARLSWRKVRTARRGGGGVHEHEPGWATRSCEVPERSSCTSCSGVAAAGPWSRSRGEVDLGEPLHLGPRQGSVLRPSRLGLAMPTSRFTCCDATAGGRTAWRGACVEAEHACSSDSLKMESAGGADDHDLVGVPDSRGGSRSSWRRPPRN